MNTKTKESAAESEAPEKTTGQAVMDEVKFFAGLGAFLLVFYTFVFGHYKIPSESMQPTLEVGDHLYVSKFAYGYSRHSLPFGLDRLPVWPEGKVLSKLPKRGDVVVFRNPNNGVVMIKRALGLPGDEIVVRQGRFYLNGQLIDRSKRDAYTYHEDRGPRSFRDRLTGRNRDHERWRYKIAITEYSEQWPGEKEPHRIYEQSDDYPLDNAAPFIVPQGTIFFMGDNRDRSHDSRVDNSNILYDKDKGPGFVPVENLIGRADLMMFSFKGCSKEEGIRCPPRRFMKKL